jgi:hypothetical protein
LTQASLFVTSGGSESLLVLFAGEAMCCTGDVKGNVHVWFLAFETEAAESTALRCSRCEHVIKLQPIVPSVIPEHV